jgi:hypothetical protein
VDTLVVSELARRHVSVILHDLSNVLWGQVLLGRREALRAGERRAEGGEREEGEEGKTRRGQLGSRCPCN